MNTNKIFTVIICVYNAQNRIHKTIDSVIGQCGFTDLVDQLILVDNNSTDRTKEIMNEYARGNKNIRYIFEPLQGLSYARLAGVNNTKSDWLVFVDDDNILQPEWLIKANEYIQRDNTLGIFNGAIIPLIEEPLNDSQRAILKIMYKKIACTHLEEKHIHMFPEDQPLKEAIGAGMVVRTEPLKKLAQKGWTKLTDRKGESLSSGGDTEISHYVRSLGYSYGYNPNMLIKHLIPLFRLSEEYAMRLITGQIKSNMELGFSLTFGELLFFKCKTCIKLFLSKFALKKEQRFKWKFKFNASKILIKCMEEKR